MINILFLCHGNICRSPMAEFVMKEYVRQAGLNHEVLVESAALHRDEIGSDIHWGTEEILDRYHIPHTPRQAHLAIKADYKKFDYLIGVDRYNMRDMLRLFNSDPAKKCSLMMDWWEPHEMWLTLGIPAILIPLTPILMRDASPY